MKRLSLHLHLAFFLILSHFWMRLQRREAFVARSSSTVVLTRPSAGLFCAWGILKILFSRAFLGSLLSSIYLWCLGWRFFVLQFGWQVSPKVSSGLFRKAKMHLLDWLRSPGVWKHSGSSTGGRDFPLTSLTVFFCFHDKEEEVTWFCVMSLGFCFSMFSSSIV